MPASVLIIEDSVDTARLLAETLRGEAFAPRTVTSARAGLRHLAERGADCVLLDYRLPDSDDLELLSRVVRLVPDGRVILMTAYGTPEIAQAALDCGAFKVLQKPFEMQEITSLIGRVVATRPS